MEKHRRAMGLSAAVIVFVMTLRLLGGGFFSAVGEDPWALSLLVFLQTGRIVRWYEVSQPETTLPAQTQPPPTTLPKPELPVFSQQDLAAVSVSYGCDYRPDLQELLLSPLSWNLMGEQPTVLIIHTHATEAYTKQPGENYAELYAYRTLDEDYNMVSIGEEVARVLEAGGIRVIHDRTLHDAASYNDSYSAARETVQKHLSEHPSIQMVLDIHRDASDGTGGQLTTVGTVGGQKSAQLMMVVGTDASGNHHPNWQKNLALGLKMTALLEQTDPGLTRPVNLRAQRFNMDLTPGSLLIEVGAAGNTHSEALLAAGALGRAILALAQGTR